MIKTKTKKRTRRKARGDTRRRGCRKIHFGSIVNISERRTESVQYVKKRQKGTRRQEIKDKKAAQTGNKGTEKGLNTGQSINSSSVHDISSLFGLNLIEFVSASLASERRSK
jgi:hypothetical protein